MNRARNWIKSKLEKLATKKHDVGRLPWAAHPPEFPRITKEQRLLLFQLLRLTPNETMNGEFWWCTHFREERNGKVAIGRRIDGLICGIKLIRRDGTFDHEKYSYAKWEAQLKNRSEGKRDDSGEWHSVSQTANMTALENAGYVTVSSIEQQIQTDSIEEKWRRFSVTQRAYDFQKHYNSPELVRILAYAWKKSENHWLALLFGILGALIIRLVELLLQLLRESLQ